MTTVASVYAGGLLRHGGLGAAVAGPVLPAGALAPEGQGVVVDHLADRLLGVAAAAHLLDELRDGQRVRLAPVAGRVGHDTVSADHLDDVGRPPRRALG